MISDERKQEYRRVKHSVFSWSERHPDIKGIAVVGPWARREARMDSHLDLVVLTLDKRYYAPSDYWIRQALPSPCVITGAQTWGFLTELEVRLPSGLVIDFGFVPPSVASINPFNPTMVRLVATGCIPLVDPEGMIERLIESVLTGVR